MIPPVVDLTWLRAHPEAMIADVRWYLDGRSGREAYDAGHLPGAVFIDLDEALSAPASTEAGRHPLPDPKDFAAAMEAAGIGADSIVVGYDDGGGFSAGRLIWMLRALGVDAALLDGGLTAWDGELSTDPAPDPEGDISFPVGTWGPELIATIDEAAAAGPMVIDARSAERFRGEGPNRDAQAGHIPGSRSAPMTDNLTDGRRFKTPEQLRERFAALGITDAGEVISSCGSGVTACHNLLAMEYAGLGRGRLYPGSWSQYAATDRPIATGD
ncbi:sulfurtransferase [Enemella sp. A6]|uniref:sulfurtransferase n=1 Tax=Enemella sp. A6 TaxID=3440152 RepID=UPI003EB9DA32